MGFFSCDLAWAEVYQFVHSYGAHFDLFMADEAKAITKAKTDVFPEGSDCSCSGGKRLIFIYLFFVTHWSLEDDRVLDIGKHEGLLVSRTD